MWPAGHTAALRAKLAAAAAQLKSQNLTFTLALILHPIYHETLNCHKTTLIYLFTLFNCTWSCSTGQHHHPKSGQVGGAGYGTSFILLLLPCREYRHAATSRLLMRTSYMLFLAMKSQKISTAVVLYNEQPHPNGRLANSHTDLPWKSQTSRWCQALPEHETALLQAQGSYLVHFLEFTLCCKQQHNMEPQFECLQRQWTVKAISLSTMLPVLVNQPCICARTKLLGCCKLYQPASVSCMLLQQSIMQGEEIVCMPCYVE